MLDRQHSEEEWESVKEIFCVLYQTQGKTLKEVGRLLSEKYDFHATPRQYKTRIASWHAYKSINDDVNLRPAASSAVPNHELSAIFALPIQQLTLPLSRCLISSGHYRGIEFGIEASDVFYSGVLHVDVDRSQVREQPDEWSLRKFFDLANAISAYSSASRCETAWILYNKLLGLVTSFLQERNPIVFVCFLQICCRFWQQGQRDLLRHFLQSLVHLAISQHLDRHPLRLLSSACLHSLDYLPDLLVMCSLKASNILKTELGALHPQTLGAARGLYSALFVKGEFSAAMEAFAPVATAEARIYKEGTYGRHEAQFRIIRCQLAMYELQSASTGIEDVIALVKRLEEAQILRETELHKMRLDVLEVQGELLRLRMDPAAEVVLETALQYAKDHFELRDKEALAETHLQHAKLSLREGTHSVSFTLPC